MKRMLVIQIQRGTFIPLQAPTKQNALVKISIGPPTSCVLQEKKVGEDW